MAAFQEGQETQLRFCSLLSLLWNKSYILVYGEEERGAGICVYAHIQCNTHIQQVKLYGYKTDKCLPGVGGGKGLTAKELHMRNLE